MSDFIYVHQICQASKKVFECYIRSDKIIGYSKDVNYPTLIITDFGRVWVEEELETVDKLVREAESLNIKKE